MIIAFILKPIEKILNHYIHLDPETAQRLPVLTGKVIAINLHYFNCTLYFLFTREGMQLCDQYEGYIDVTMRGTPLDFLRFNLSGNNTAIFAKDIEVSGDLDVAQQFQEIFAHLEIDWEEQLSRVTGDVIAHQIGNFFRALSSWARQSAGTLRQDLSEYVHEEARVFPPREELQDFFAAIDHMRNDVDRLEKRIQRLQAHL